MNIKGYFYAALAACLYGTNPAFAVPLYGTGMGTASVLLFRYLLGIPLLAAIIIGQSRSLALSRQEFTQVFILGIIMAVSSLALFESYKYLNPGVASTLLFAYPILTSLIMIIFFHERFRLVICICLFVMAAGLYLLMNPLDAPPSGMGILLIFISSLTYAIYLVMVKVSKVIPRIPVLKSLLYQLLFGSIVFSATLMTGERFTLPHTFYQWWNLMALAILPTVLSLLLTLRAIALIGPTPTAIFGALEPVTAVVLSALVLGESLTPGEFAGGFLILAATMLVVLADKAEKLLAAIWPRKRGGYGE